MTIAVAVFATVQSMLRLYLGLGMAGLLGSDAEEQVNSLLESPLADPTMSVVVPFALLGVLGIITAIGLAAELPWGFYGTVVLSLITILYDAWAVLAIQISAALGVVLPMGFIAYLFLRGRYIIEPRRVTA